MSSNAASPLRRRSGLLVALAVVASLAAVGVVRARGTAVHAAAVTRRDLEQHIVASGRVWVPTRIEVSTQTPGLVVSVGVVEGQRARAGDLLVQLDDAEAHATVAQAKAAVDQANARIDQLRRVGSIVANEEVRQAEANLERASADYDRAQKLLASGAVAQVDLDNARRTLELARAQATGAKAQQVSSAPMGADSRLALTQLFQAEAQLAGATVRLGQTRIRAVQDGVVLTRSVEPGDVVQPSRVLLVMAAGDDSQLVFQADERNLAAIALGQRARASADAYPDQAFDAVVTYLAPSIDPQRGSIEVRLRVTQPPKLLRPDMTVSIDLTVATRAHTLTVPSDAVRDRTSVAPWVFVVEGGRAVRKDVHLGLRGEGTVEIASGLAEGEAVLVPDGQIVLPGQRVRPAGEGR